MSELDPVIEFCKKDVDRTVLRETLRLTPDERVRRLVRILQEVDQLWQRSASARRRLISAWVRSLSK
jgi:hypothetical protein